MTNSECVPFVSGLQSPHIASCDTDCEWQCPCYWPSVSYHFLQWMTGCECVLVLPSSPITYGKQKVSDSAISFCQAVPSHPIQWSTDCEWCLHLLGSLITSHAMTNSEWVPLSIFHVMQFHYISCHDQRVSHTPFFCQAVSFHDQQKVGDTALFLSCTISHLIPWPTDCEWHYPFSVMHCISSHDEQDVSETPLFLSWSVISFHFVANRKWVALPFLCLVV